VLSHPKDGIDLAAMEPAIIKFKLKACWVMTNFQNPLGSLMPETNKKALGADTRTGRFF